MEYDSIMYMYLEQKSYSTVQLYERNNNVYIWAMYKDNYKTEYQYKIHLHYAKLTHQLSFRKNNLKLDHRTGEKWFIHGPKHRNKN